MSRIEIHVQLGRWPSNSDIRLCLELDPIRQEAHMPLDFPVHSSGNFCTPVHVVRRVMQTREGVAKELTQAIMKALGERDMIDGFPKQDTLKGRQ